MFASIYRLALALIATDGAPIIARAPISSFIVLLIIALILIVLCSKGMWPFGDK